MLILQVNLRVSFEGRKLKSFPRILTLRTHFFYDEAILITGTKLAPPAGFEPASYKLTACRTTVVLEWNEIVSNRHMLPHGTRRLSYPIGSLTCG